MTKLKQVILLWMILAACLVGCSRMPTTNFQHLDLPRFSNFYLMCPKNYCNFIPNAESPVFPVSAEDLFNLFNEMVSSERNVNFVYSIPEQGQFGLTVYTSFLQFPDDVDVQFIALTDTTSTLAIYSQSRYLPYDFGLNRLRVEKWINDLVNRAKNAPPKATQP